jgi:drug/metabolite transporter (DMT)-like permease
VLLFVVSVFAAVILLDKRENTFCVPMERSASIVAGIAASLLLAWFFGLKPPTGIELIGAALMISAVVLLAVAPRLKGRPRPTSAEVEQARVEGSQ